MGEFLRNTRGFTLVEVLAAITILAVIALPMMSFFTQAYSYTNNSQDETIAINVARNVLQYFKKQNFNVMKSYLEKEGPDFVEFTWEDCVAVPDTNCKDNRTTCSEKKFDKPIDGGGTVSVSLFDGGASPTGEICTHVLYPTINGIPFDEKKIQVFLMKYRDTTLLSSPPATLPEPIQDALTAENTKYINDTTANKNDIITELQQNMLKVYVIVNWHEKRPPILLEGVITDETLR